MQNASKPAEKEYRSKVKVIMPSLTNSLIIRISILPPMSDKSYSNLFLTEFISRCPMIILQEYLTWRFFSPIIMSSWRSSGPGFMEIVSDSGLLILLRQLPLMLTSFLEFKKHSKLRIPEIRFLGKIEELVLCGDHIHQNAIHQNAIND